MAYSLRHPQPSAPPAWGNARAPAASVVEGEEAVAYAFRIGDHAGNVQIMLVNNLQVHEHQHFAGGRGSTINQEVILPEVTDEQHTSEAQLEHFHANDPTFHSCAFSRPQGVDFGRKLVSRRYKAQKHGQSRHNMIIYTQCSSSAQAISHAFTLYLSHKRTKNAIFLFDCSLKLASKSWPSSIYFTEIESLIWQLGPGYQYHRRKVKGRGFSLYFYLIKRMGDQFSERGRRTWSNLFSLGDSVDNGSSSPSSSQVIAQVAGISLGVLGAL